MTGLIQAATLTDPANPLSGGTITVNNQLIMVPANTILQMPAAALTWQQVFTLAPAPWGPTQTGLALSDVPPPKGSFEAHVIGNRVGNSYIAGLMFLAQNSLQGSDGFINYIDYNTGFFRVGGVMNDPTTGQRVKINDPIGKFGRAWSPDVRFTIDENNPTCCADTGFPMGIPRSVNDPFIPHSNRPLDPASPTGFAMIFTMPPPQFVVPGSPDPTLMAPFEVGDHVAYAGILLDDAQGSYIAASEVSANVGIFTAPGTDPAYCTIEGVTMGVGGTTVAGAAEATIRTVVEGFTTDPSRNINLFGVDVDNCSAASNLRDYGVMGVDQGPPLGAVKGRWRGRFGVGNGAGGGFSTTIRGPLAGTFLPATREVRAEIAGAVQVQTVTGDANHEGITSGQYQAPTFEFLFPENGNVGTPIVPNNFETMPFLALGSGPIAVGGPIISQLAPWPGAAAPQFVRCGTAANVSANAGPDQTVNSGAPVALAGSGAGGPAGTLYDYAWSQISGPAVVLSGALTANPTFSAPIVQPGNSAVLTFQLTVTGNSLVGTDTVSITVRPIVSDTVTVLTAEYRVGKQRLTVTATSTASAANPPAVMTFLGLDAAGAAVGPAQSMTLAGGVYTGLWVGAPTVVSVRVISDHGGVANSPLTRLR